MLSASPDDQRGQGQGDTLEKAGVNPWMDLTVNHLGGVVWVNITVVLVFPNLVFLNLTSCF